MANFLSLQYARDGALFGLTGDVMDVLLDGLGVGAWVALWWPFDQLFQRWQGRLEERTYRSLPGIAVRVLPARSHHSTRLRPPQTVDACFGALTYSEGYLDKTEQLDGNWGRRRPKRAVSPSPTSPTRRATSWVSTPTDRRTI